MQRCDPSLRRASRVSARDDKIKKTGRAGRQNFELAGEAHFVVYAGKKALQTRRLRGFYLRAGMKMIWRQR